MAQFEHGADVTKMMERYGIDEILDFSSNVNIFIPGKIEKLLRGITPNMLNQYPDINYSALRKKLSKKYSIAPEQIIVGNGSTELIFLLAGLKEISRIGIVHPTFGEYLRASKLSDKEIIPFYYDENFRLDMNRIDLKQVDALFICNPNNPSGNVNNLSELLVQAKENNVLLIVDETFMDFVEDQSHSLLSRVSEYENLFVLKAVTKFYSMTGVRLGYGFSSKDWIQKLWDIKEPWTVNVFAEYLADAIFDEDFEKQTVAFYKEEIHHMEKELKAISGLIVYPTKSNYFLLRLPEHISSKELKEKMILRHNILIRDCSNYIGLNEHYIRVNIKQREYNQKLIQALKKEITIE